MNENEDVVLECRLVAVPEPDIVWFFDDEVVESKENIVVNVDSDMHMYCSTVKISKVKKIQEGRYKVIAKNREGKSSIEIPLKVISHSIYLIVFLYNLSKCLIVDNEIIFYRCTPIRKNHRKF